MTYFLGETLGLAVLDSGCSKTVCGSVWIQSYCDTLSVQDRQYLKKCDSIGKFRFGDGKTYDSLYSLTIPFYVGNNRHFLTTDVVNCDVPLLLSRESLEKANAIIDFQKAEVTFLNHCIPVIITNSGHYCLPLTRNFAISNKYTQTILFNFKMCGKDVTNEDLKKKVLKLHKQFAHPHPDRLLNLLKEADIHNSSVFELVKEVSASCEVCKRYKKSPLRPVVGFPLARDLNECVAVDLKQIGDNFYILHIIDHLTRFSQACVIRSKKKGVIVKGLLENWVCLFGPPQKILSDNGGEFVNDEIVDFAEKFNVNLKTTAAESAWSNGLVERHNAILADMLDKVMKDTNCCAEIALHWTIAAKNCLMNVYGFSPNSLVFGRNPSFPNVLNNRPPANNPVALSKYLSDNLNALHSARDKFIQQESSERLQRAISRKTRTYSDNVFNLGDMVYYFRNNSSYWHGPAKVIGRDGQQCLLKQGGIYIRVHPCRMQHVCESVAQDDLANNQQESVMPSFNESSPLNKDHDSSDSDISESEGNPHLQSDHDGISSENSEDVNSSIRKVLTNADLPKKDSNIQFKLPQDTEWRHCTVISRGGKASTANWHFLNIQEPGSDAKCVGFKNASWADATDNIASSSSESTLYVNLSIDENQKYETAKLDELKKWKDMRVYREIPNEGQSTISTRWVLTRKNSNNQMKYKARLVARGFEEVLPSRTDSPTCSKSFLRLIFTLVASNKWLLHSLDIKSAFLQGMPIDREVFIKPPSEAKTNSLWLLLQCVYGLSDASRQWYLRVQKELLACGLEKHKYDNSVFFWYHDGTLQGVVAVHVDDFLYAGTKLFQNTVISQIKSMFVVGSEEESNFVYLGIQLQCFINSKIELSMEAYTSSLKEFDLAVLSSGSSDPLSASQVRCLKQLSGQINWLVTQCRPDVAFENCVVGNSVTKACGRDIHFANKAVRKLKNSKLSLSFHCDIDLSECAIVSFCDASFGSLPNGGSQGAFITFIIGKNGLYSPIAWQSRRLRRVIKSTIAAECLAAIEAAENTILIAFALKQFLKNSSIKTLLYCDNKSLVSSVHSSTNVEDKRLLIDICVLRDMISQKELTDIVWVPTNLQLANCMTKNSASIYSLLFVLNNKLVFNFCNGSFEEK